MNYCLFQTCLPHVSRAGKLLVFICIFVVGVNAFVLKNSYLNSYWNWSWREIPEWRSCPLKKLWFFRCCSTIKAVARKKKTMIKAMSTMKKFITDALSMTDVLRMVIFSSYRYFAVFLIFHFKIETTGMKKRLRPVTRFLILHTALTIDVIDGQAFFLTSTFNNVDTFSVKSFQLSIESCLVSQYRSFPVFRNCSSHECFKISKVKLQFTIKIDSLKTMKFSKNS